MCGPARTQSAFHAPCRDREIGSSGHRNVQLLSDHPITRSPDHPISFESQLPKKPGAFSGPGDSDLSRRYWTFKATSSITNEVSRLESSVPMKRTLTVCPLKELMSNECCIVTPMNCG